MVRKITIITFIALIVLSLTSFVCATNDTNLGDELKSSIHQTGNSVMNAGSSITGAIQDGGHAVQNATQNAGTTTRNVGTTASARANTGYTTTRTAANGTYMGMNSTAWIWLVLGIVAVAVVFLSWYYMSDTNRENLHDHE